MVNDVISPFELYFTLVFVESIREDEYSNQITGGDDIKRDVTQCETFF